MLRTTCRTRFGASRRHLDLNRVGRKGAGAQIASRRYAYGVPAARNGHVCARRDGGDLLRRWLTPRQRYAARAMCVDMAKTNSPPTLSDSISGSSSSAMASTPIILRRETFFLSAHPGQKGWDRFCWSGQVHSCVRPVERGPRALAMMETEEWSVARSTARSAVMFGRARPIPAAPVRHLRAAAASRATAICPCITATALAATAHDARAFRSGRQFAAWLGLVPRQNPSGGKERLGGISKMGDRYLRHLLVVGKTGGPLYAAQEDQHQPLGKPIARAQACPVGYRRRSQQNGPGRMGRHGSARVASDLRKGLNSGSKD